MKLAILVLLLLFDLFILIVILLKKYCKNCNICTKKMDQEIRDIIYFYLNFDSNITKFSGYYKNKINSIMALIINE